MADVLSLYDVLALPNGAQIVSDRGEVTLLTMVHDGPNKLTLERVPLGSAVSVAQLYWELEQRGLLRGEQTSAAPLEGVSGRLQEASLDLSRRPAVEQRGSEPVDPETAPPSAPADPAALEQAPRQQPAAPTKPPRGPAKGFTFEKKPCPNGCGKRIARNQIVNHVRHCAGTPAAPTPATITCEDCGTVVTKSNLARHRKVCDQRPSEAVPPAIPEPGSSDHAPEPVVFDDPPLSELEQRLQARVPTAVPPTEPVVLRCGLCFDPTPELHHVNGRELCARCAARKPAPKWDGQVAA